MKVKKEKEMREFIDTCKLIKKEDYEKNTQESLVMNYESILQSIMEFEDLLVLLEKTEQERLRLYENNLSLKKEMGVLYFVKEILENAKVYGYADLSKVAIRIEHQEELRKMREDANSQVQEKKK